MLCQYVFFVQIRTLQLKRSMENLFTSISIENIWNDKNKRSQKAKKASMLLGTKIFLKNLGTGLILIPMGHRLHFNYLFFSHWNFFYFCTWRVIFPSFFIFIPRPFISFHQFIICSVFLYYFSVALIIIFSFVSFISTRAMRSTTPPTTTRSFYFFLFRHRRQT